MSEIAPADRALILGAAAIGTAVAWVVIASLPPMEVRAGTEGLGLAVPVVYQVSVFPAFIVFLATLGLDVARRREAKTWLARALLLTITSLLAIARLRGAIPLSGHVLFLAAALGYELTSSVYRPERESHVILGAIIPGALVTAWYKIVVWGDSSWFFAAVALGGVLGVFLAKRARG